MDSEHFQSVLSKSMLINKSFESNVVLGGASRLEDAAQQILSLISIDVGWSLYNNRFITFGNEMKLYQVDAFADTPQLYGGCQLCDVKLSNCIQSQEDIRHVRSLAWNNKLMPNDYDVLCALGYPKGRILLSCFSPERSSTLACVGREFSPKVSRACNSLDFNGVEVNLLAAGFDKSRSEGCVMVWDVNHSPGNPMLDHTSTGYAYQTPGANKPLTEFSNNEQVQCVKWHEKNFIFTGINNKQIKMWDIRDVQKDPRGVITRAVYGICTDPFSDNRFASFYDRYIYVWDTRKMEGPVATIQENSSIVKIEWCPTRSNVIGALMKDTSYIKLYDYKDFKNISDDPEPALMGRDITPFERNNMQIISSFSWHPTKEFQMTTISTNGVLRHFKALDRITLNWSPTSEIIWTHGKKILQCIDSRASFYESIDDVATSMRELATKGYGQNTEKLWQLFAMNTGIYYAWKWLALRIVPLLDEPKAASTRPEQDLFSQDCPERLCGVIGVLFNAKRTQLAKQAKVITPFMETNKNRKVYINVPRAKVLQHCGWSSRSRFITAVEVDIAALDLNESSGGGDGDYNLGLIGDLYKEEAGTSSTKSSITESTPAGLERLFDDQMPCEQFIESNKAEGCYSRLAAVYVFNGKLLEAIQVLEIASTIDEGRGHEEESVSLNAIALALSAYVASSNELERSDKTSIWFKLCASLKGKFKDSYIKAIFSFLSMTTYDDDSYAEIINDDALNIADRVALAAMYMSDSALAHNLLDLKEQLFEKAELSAILLTGISDEGLELFSKYIEKTSDVQTVSLLLLWALPCPTSKMPIARTWIENYRSLLDCWQLWNVRAKFDIRWYAGIDYDEEPDQKIYAACNVCQHPLAAYISVDEDTYQAMVYQNPQAHMSAAAAHQYTRMSQQTTATASSKFRQIACSNCYKSLPRCSLCLMQLGTMAGTLWRPGHSFVKPERKLTPFASWFTWCQTCRHGGHAYHVISWFSENNDCPVADCRCKCLAMDPQANITNKMARAASKANAGAVASTNANNQIDGGGAGGVSS